MPLLAVKVAIEWKLRELRRKIAKARKTWLTESAKEVRKEARKSIRKSKTASEPGEPPRGKSQNLKKSIRYKVGSRDAWIGPTRPAGSHANILEGGAEHMDPRPFMGPALERARPKIRRFRRL